MDTRKYEIDLPRGFSTIAKAAFASLDGTLYAVGNKIVFTDESGNVEEPRWEGDSFEELEKWLLRGVEDWLYYKTRENDSPMFDALEENLRLA